MPSCDDCREHLWDFAYGLLDAAAAETVRAHLADCPACLAAFDQVETQRKRVKSALLPEKPVPLFAPPTEEAEPVILPLFARPFSRHARHFAIAAAALIATALPFALYSRGLSQREAELTVARQQLDDIVSRRAETRKQIEVQLVASVRGTTAGLLHLQVFGSARYQPGAANPMRVATSDMDGNAVPARVTVRLVKPDGQLLFDSGTLSGQGEVVVALPELPPAEVAACKLEVTARRPRDEARVETVLSVAEPAFTTQLTFSKSVYQPGETVFVRSLTLDPFRRPPEAPLKLTYHVTDPNQRERRLTGPGLTLDGGVGGFDFVIDPKWPDGTYAVTVRDAQDRFPPHTRTFQLRRDPPPQRRQEITFDRGSYKPGDAVRATLKAIRLIDGKPAASEAVTVTLYLNDKAVGKPLEFRTDGDGVARLDVPLPADLAAGAPRLSVLTGPAGERDRIVRPLAVDWPRLSVELFPQGGDLVEGVPNRVYVRARTLDNRPARMTGRVTDGRGREITTVQTSAGLGIFPLTPKAGECYTLHVTGPDGVAGATELPRAIAGGVALSVPAGVIRADEPVHVMLYHAGRPQPVLVAAFCHNRLVALRQAIATDDGTKVSLPTAAGIVGVLRVTVFDPQTSPPSPIAERLVFRRPGADLSLSVTPTRTDNRVRLDLRSADEQDHPADAWLAVTVLRESAATGSGPSLPAYFHLLSDLRQPGDLENADVFLDDTPQDAVALDQLLGTQGWRRFVPGPAAAGVKEADLLKLDNREQLEDKYATAVAAVTERLAADEQRLAQQEQEHKDELGCAVAALTAYRGHGAAYLRSSVGAFVVFTFSVGATVLAWGLMRIVHGRLAVRPLMGSAFALLALGTFGYVAPGYFLTPNAAGGRDFASGPWQPPALGNLAWTRNPLPAIIAEGLGSTEPQATSSVASAYALAEHRADGDALPRGLFPVRDKQNTTPPLVNPLPVRAYAFEAANGTHAAAPEVLVWHPYVLAEKGQAQIQFDVPAGNGKYRVFVNGHTRAGRLGTARLSLDAAR